MKMLVTTVSSWCDHPECVAERLESDPPSQETFEIDFWVYTVGRGRKTSPIRVEVCEEHLEQMKSLYQEMKKFDQKST